MTRRVAVTELTGAALDWAVAKCQNVEVDDQHRGIWFPDVGVDPGRVPYTPSTDGSQGGPIIEREGICLRALRRPGHSMDGQWLAMYDKGNTGTMTQWVEFWFGDKSKRRFWKGETYLIAAMRCYVGTKLGTHVEIPEELL